MRDQELSAAQHALTEHKRELEALQRRCQAAEAESEAAQRRARRCRAAASGTVRPSRRRTARRCGGAAGGGALPARSIAQQHPSTVGVQEVGHPEGLHPAARDREGAQRARLPGAARAAAAWRGAGRRGRRGRRQRRRRPRPRHRRRRRRRHLDHTPLGGAMRARPLALGDRAWRQRRWAGSFAREATAWAARLSAPAM